MVSLVIRLKEFIEFKRMGVQELAGVLGYNSPQKLYRLFNTENAWPSCQIIEDMSNYFHELNLNWLFTGRGNMLFEAQENIDFKEKYYNCQEEKSWIATKCLEEKEKYEPLLIRLNKMDQDKPLDP
jgi:hypothetical protein